MKTNKKADYIGLYGRVSIPKSWCDECEDYSFVFDGELACCGKSVEVIPERYKRESEPEQHRRTLPLKERQHQLEEQDYRCFYCERAFDTYIIRKGKLVKLRIVWDHFVPYAYAQDNS